MKNLVSLETLHVCGRVNSCVKNNNIIDNIKTHRMYISILIPFGIDKIITNDSCSMTAQKIDV